MRGRRRDFRTGFGERARRRTRRPRHRQANRSDRSAERGGPDRQARTLPACQARTTPNSAIEGRSLHTGSDKSGELTAQSANARSKRLVSEFSQCRSENGACCWMEGLLRVSFDLPQRVRRLASLNIRHIDANGYIKLTVVWLISLVFLSHYAFSKSHDVNFDQLHCQMYSVYRLSHGTYQTDIMQSQLYT